MKFSEQWLREWVNPPVETAGLAEQLTMAGLEVEAIEPVAPESDGVVVGKVLAVSPHPDADKLRVCEVDAGEAQPLQIVCGASNVHEGMFAPLAKIGAYLPNAMRIKRAKLRGVESEGMLCSAKELGLADAAEGLMPLGADARPGQTLDEYLSLRDVSIELSLTPNRGDCLSIAGVAREVGVLNRVPVTGPNIEAVAAQVADSFPVSVEAPAACPRYVGRVIRGIRAAATTPMWMQERLRRSGLRSLAPVVDVTNYVLLELGQPMHAFDLARLNGGIVVRLARDGETITLLDGQRITLEAGTLVIADHGAPQAIAGIMGGLDSAVNDATHDIFLESAFFAPAAIAGRARSYGLHTDSSHRFERGVDPELQRRATERATELLLDIVGGAPGPVIEVHSEADLPERRPVRLRAERIARVLGIDIPADDVSDYLTRLGMVSSRSGTGWEVIPPPFRFDITIEEDLVEEVGRIHGYACLPSRRPRAALTMASQPEARLDWGQVRSTLVDRGYHEAITYSFVDPRLQEVLDPEVTPAGLANPLSADMSVMRTSLWPGLVQALVHNQNRQQERVRLFEMGRRFLPSGAEIIEETMVAGVATGPVLPEQWGAANQIVDFFDIKADVETLLGLTGRPEDFIFTSTKHRALHPGQSADILMEGKVVGRLGAIHPGSERELGVQGRIYLFELDLGAVAQGGIPIFRELSKFPSIRRDLALVIDTDVSSRAVGDCITDAAGGLLQNLQLFDVYTGKGIDLGKKSIALGLTLQDSSRTLKEEDVDAVLERVVRALSENLGATLRE